jgi:hypothetical protein
VTLTLDVSISMGMEYKIVKKSSSGNILIVNQGTDTFNGSIRSSGSPYTFITGQTGIMTLIKYTSTAFIGTFTAYT